MPKRKKCTPVTISNTEILNLAIQHLQFRVNKWRETISSVPNMTDVEEQVQVICADDLAKIEMLRTMYLFETGTEYNL